MFGALGCSGLDAAEDTCGTLGRSIDDGCRVATGGSSGTGSSSLSNEWRCLEDGYEFEPPAMSPAQALTYNGFAQDYRLQVGLQALGVPTRIRSCLITDFACAAPGLGEAMAAPNLPGDPPMRNRFVVGLPYGAPGFIRVEADNYVTQDYYLGGLMLSNVVSARPINMVSLTSLQEFVRGLGADPAAAGALGTLAVYVTDCDGNLAPNVELRLSQADDPAFAQVIPWGVQNFIPVPNRPTDAAGIAGFINLPIRNVAVEAVVEGRTFGSTSIRIEAGRLTSGTIRPDDQAAE